jgi:hypothetical protein
VSPPSRGRIVSPSNSSTPDTCQQRTGPVEKHQSLAAASFTKPEKGANRQPANWTFSTGPTLRDTRFLTHDSCVEKRLLRAFETDWVRYRRRRIGATTRPERHYFARRRRRAWKYHGGGLNGAKRVICRLERPLCRIRFLSLRPVLPLNDHWEEKSFAQA